MFHLAPEIDLFADATPPSIPVVSIEGIHNAALVGSIQGNVRLVAGDRIILSASGGSFAITDKKLLTNIVTIPVLRGMQFVASKKGKKYYPVAYAGGQNLTPANRIYFQSTVEAEKAGYRR